MDLAEELVAVDMEEAEVEVAVEEVAETLLFFESALLATESGKEKE